MWELWGLYSRQAPLDLDYSTVGSNVMLIPTASVKSGTFKLTRETRQCQLITVDKCQGMARWLRYQLLQTIWLDVEHLHGGSQLSELSSSENLKPLLASMSTRHDTHTHIQNTQITSKERKKKERIMLGCLPGPISIRSNAMSNILWLDIHSDLTEPTYHQ